MESRQFPVDRQHADQIDVIAAGTLLAFFATLIDPLSSRGHLIDASRYLLPRGK
jgi:hypothetical protein